MMSSDPDNHVISLSVQMKKLKGNQEQRMFNACLSVMGLVLYQALFKCEIIYSQDNPAECSMYILAACYR